MPERLTASQRESGMPPCKLLLRYILYKSNVYFQYIFVDENERRLSERKSSRHSGRMSGRLSISKSSRLSRNNNLRYSTEHFEHIGSPRVKLNDVSKLLQNSQSINIRMVCVAS